MFSALKKIIWADSNNPDMVQIPSGSFFLVRPNSPKGKRECLFKDANATIRRTGTEFHYHLVITRVYDEGEAELEQEEGEVQDEHSFLLDEKLLLRKGQVEGCVSFAWADLDEDPNDVFEFVCDVHTTAHLANTFELTVLQCMYERKFQKSHFGASEEEIRALSYVPQSPSTPPKLSALSSTPKRTPVTRPAPGTHTPVNNSTTPGRASVPTARAAPTNANSDNLAIVSAELYLFAPENQTFVRQYDRVFAEIYRTAPFVFWMSIKNAETGAPVLSQLIESSMNAVFNNEHRSFIWCYYDENAKCWSWSLKFTTEDYEEGFKRAFAAAAYETLNQQNFEKAKAEEQEYIMNAYQDDVEMPDADREEDDASSYSSDEEEEESNVKNTNDDVFRAQSKSTAANSQLAVGYKHDRSFVVRGTKIGVFRHTNNDGLEFTTSINDAKDSKGNVLTPAKVMLHESDSSMLLMDPKHQHSVFKMDLEYGNVVEEWGIHNDVPCSNIIPDSKYAQMTPNKTFIGMSHNALFRVDPRLAGKKLVESQSKQYTTKNDFTCATTTATGKVAVASNKGDIRLFNKLGLNAKTALPAIGDPIIGIDVSNDGKWIIATCKTYILLIDTEIKDSGHVLGFDKPFPKDKKPVPKRLQLRPEHVAYMDSPVSFTAARFNTGENQEEKSIVTSTGPYVITWNFRRVKQGKIYDYQIRKYDDNVVADNFRYGADRSIVVALPHDVKLADRRSLGTPSKVLQTPTKNLRSRSKVVNSPY